MTTPAPPFDLVIAANRLPVDQVTGDDGAVSWKRSPGGLVTAMESVMASRDGAWVGWAGQASPEGDDGEPQRLHEPFVDSGMYLRPVDLTATEVADYYEGFSNDTLWPIYHDVIVPASFHRVWWRAYEQVNIRFADAVCDIVAENGVVWVHDYQLQLVPAMVRARRPDVRIGWFNHIPFPPVELFAQLPWRRHLLEGLLGADFLGFQRKADAENFVRACRRLLDLPTRGDTVSVPAEDGHRVVRAAAVPISVDFTDLESLARSPQVMERATEIRASLGNPKTVLLGVDRLDYTKGIRHRLKAYEELLREGSVRPPDVAFVQVATPSRERVDAYRELRTEVERTVGQINGEYAAIGASAVEYLHHSYPREEMAALFQAADVMLVTPLRDGMNLVAKEYVTCRHDEGGALVLSEFTGAWHELRQAYVCNPHDIEGMKNVIVRAIEAPAPEKRRRMRALRRRVADHDVQAWAANFLDALAHAPERPQATAGRGRARLRSDLPTSIGRFVAAPSVLIATDFDGVLAPLVTDPMQARPLEGTMAALLALAGLPDTHVAVVSGRDLGTLTQLTGLGGQNGITVIGSHGAEANRPGIGLAMSPAQQATLAAITGELKASLASHPHARLEEKTTAAVLHTRGVEADQAQAAIRDALAIAERHPVRVLRGKDVIELTPVSADKGSAVKALADQVGATAIAYLGDDVTDEHVFAVLGPDDLGIKIGPGDSVARFRVDSPHRVPALLDALLAGRRSR